MYALFLYIRIHAYENINLDFSLLYKNSFAVDNVNSFKRRC